MINLWFKKVSKLNKWINILCQTKGSNWTSLFDITVNIVLHSFIGITLESQGPCLQNRCNTCVQQLVELSAQQRERERGWWAIICLWWHKTWPAALGWRGQPHSVEYSWLNIRTVLIKNMEKCKIKQRFARYSSITFTEQPFVRNYTFIPTYNLFQSPGHMLFFSQVSRVRWCLLTQTWPHKLACQRLLGHITTEV